MKASGGEQLELLGLEHDDAICPDALVELMEEVCVEDMCEHLAATEGSGPGKKTKGNPNPKPTEKVVVKAPLLGEITRIGNEVLCGGSKCGTLSYLIHWRPPALAANCTVHTDCFVTCPLIAGDNAFEDGLTNWLGQAYCFSDRQNHCACAPKGSYQRRRAPSVATTK